MMVGFTLRLSTDEIAIVGYGSLFSLASLEKTLGRRYTGQMFECLIPGWRRGWDVVMPNDRYFALRYGSREYPKGIIYLNARPDASSVLNGALFVVRTADVAAFDAREWIYAREDVTATIANGAIVGGRALMYVGLPEYVIADYPESPATAAIRGTYLRIVESGLDERDSAFRNRYRDSTDAPPKHLIIDDHVEPGN